MYSIILAYCHSSVHWRLARLLRHHLRRFIFILTPNKMSWKIHTCLSEAGQVSTLSKRAKLSSVNCRSRLHSTSTDNQTTSKCYTTPHTISTSRIFFTAGRYACALYAVVVCLSLCLCVCLSHSGILLEQLDIESRKKSHTIAQEF